MNDLAVRLSALSGSPLEHCGQRVITLAQMDAVHGRPDGTARRNFNQHKDKLREGRDFFDVTEGLNEFRTGPGGGSVTLLTESGYLTLVKAFRDSLAWYVQRELVEVYFRARDFARSLPDSDAVVGLIRPLGEDVRGLKVSVFRIEERLTGLEFGVADIRQNMPRHPTKPPSEASRRQACAVILEFYNRRCPVKLTVEIVTPDGQEIPGVAVWDHMRNRANPAADVGWLVCADANQEMGEPNSSERKKYEAAFEEYQRRRAKLERDGVTGRGRRPDPEAAVADLFAPRKR